MRRAGIAALALLAALAGAQPAAAADRCKVPRGAETIAKSTRIHVYRAETRATGPEGAAYACNRRTGRRFELDRPHMNARFSSGEVFPNAAPPQLAGYHVAYAAEQHDEAGNRFAQLRTLDLATGRRRVLGEYSGDRDEHVVAFRLVASGAIAWHEVIDAEFVHSRVWLWGAGEKQLLDISASRDGIHDFAVGGTAREPLAYWMNGTLPRRAPLR